MKPQQAEVSIPLHPPGRGPPLASLPDEQPRDFILWSLFNVLAGFALAYLGCFCFPSLIFSIKVRFPQSPAPDPVPPCQPVLGSLDSGSPTPIPPPSPDPPLQFDAL